MAPVPSDGAVPGGAVPGGAPSGGAVSGGVIPEGVIQDSGVPPDGGVPDGATRLLGIVGDPIAQVRSPPLWGALFRYNKVNAVCVPFHVRADGLARFLAGFRTAENVIGLLVTVPHKIAAAKLAGGLTERGGDPDGDGVGEVGVSQGLSRVTPHASKSLVFQVDRDQG